jgi:glycosyltransferase involved in cell wall biosynthesis
MKKVVVLLSTFNGEKFIKSQLISLVNQINVNTEIFIRDDGSTDNTIKIIESFMVRYKNIYLTKGSNLGPSLSFMELVRLSPPSDLYSFSDQDDIWHQNKLYEASLKLENELTPALYFANELYIDSNDILLGKSDKNRIYKFPESLIKSNVIGCSIVFNSLFMDIIKQHYPINIVMHDSYIFRLASVLDVKMILDSNYYLRYRLHKHNYFGYSLSSYRKFLSIFKKITVLKDSRELVLGYKNLIKPNKLYLIEIFLNYRINFGYKFKLLLLVNSFNLPLHQKLLFLLNVLFNRYV